MKTEQCITELAVEDKEQKPAAAPFYHTNEKSGKPTKEMIGTRAVIMTLAKEGKPMTVYALTQATDMPRANIGKYCRQLKKLGVVKADEVKKPSQS